MNTQHEERVRAVAYSLWLSEGRPDGRAEAHWLKASELVNAEANGKVPAPRKRAVATRKSAPKKRSQ